MTTSIPGRIFGAVVVIAAAMALGAFMQSALHGRADAPLMSDTDVAFARMMMNHHQQAITLCDLLTAEAGVEIRTLAEQIEVQQQAEIGTMMGWLQMADQPLSPPVSDTTHSMSGHPGQHIGAQMGLASSDELSRLGSATGADNESLFLQLMTRHHQGGADMAYDQVRNGSNEAVRRTALAMVTEQGQEIQLMTYLMTQRDVTPLPAP